MGQINLVGYYDRTNDTKHYEKHLFRAGYVLQSAELNEIQEVGKRRLKRLSDAIFKDGDIIRDAGIVIDANTGTASLEGGAIYVGGAVRGVEPATLTIPTTGRVLVGVYLKSSVVTEVDDPELRDPATGVRNYNEPGAARLKEWIVWGYQGDGQSGEFYPVHEVVDGSVIHKEPPPQLDAVTQSIAAYDRDSAGGTYIVSGLTVNLESVGANDQQVYTISEGRARLNGFPIELPASRRVAYNAAPDLLRIEAEPKVSQTANAQRINLDFGPAAKIEQVKITEEKTVTITHGSFSGAADILPDTAVIQIMSVVQGGTTYIQGTDYRLQGGAVDWSLTGNEPALGSSYQVTYRYIATATITSPDEFGFTVAGAVPGTLVLTTYQAKLPRIDRLCLNEKGEAVWVKGAASLYGVSPPAVGSNLLPLATVHQTWVQATMNVSPDGTRMVPMSDIAALNQRVDALYKELAINKLSVDLAGRDSGLRRGLFADPLVDDSMTDAGIQQTAAIVDGELSLAIDAQTLPLNNDVQVGTTCAYAPQVAIAQEARSTTMKCNPYQAFDPVPATVRLTPSVDRWTITQSRVVDNVTRRFTRWGWWWWGRSASVSTRNEVISASSSEIEYLRPITVHFEIKGFGPGETVKQCLFDGIDVATSNV